MPFIEFIRNFQNILTFYPIRDYKNISINSFRSKLSRFYNYGRLLPICFNPNKSPSNQFKIKNLLNLNISILINFHISLINIIFYLIIIASKTLTLNLLIINYNKEVINSLSISQKSIYTIIHNIVINQINANKE